jgi:hypothetical protein
MKRLFSLTFCFIIFNNLCDAQITNVFNTTGYAGAGTTLPVTQLHLYSNSVSLSNSNFITIENRGSNINYSTKHVIGGILFAAYGSKTPSNVAGIWTERGAISSNSSSAGDIVFGASKSLAGVTNIALDNKLPPELMRLTCWGGILLNSGLSNTDLNRPAPGDDLLSEIRGASKTASWMDDGFLRLSAGGGSSANTKSYIDLSGYTASASDRDRNIVFGTIGLERMRITAAGNVLIGKTIVSPSNYLLDVNGSFRANKVVVNTDGADYVFDSSYKLFPLSEMEAFVQLHHHLPDIQPAKQMKENGLDVGDNQILLLQKIEELTLYLINQNKKQQTQQEIIDQQNKLLKDQQEILKKMQEDINCLKKANSKS